MQWINNSLVQSAIISPVIGALLGILFAGLNNPPSGGTTTVQQTTIVFKNVTNINNNGGRGSSSSDDGISILILSVMLIAGITWGYSRYASEILGYWANGLFTCSTFILAAGITSALRGQYSSYDWVWYIFMPTLAIAFSFHLLYLAKIGIIPNVREFARMHTFMDFYLNVLREEHRSWLLFQIAGVLFGVLAAIIATMRSLHYLSLMNQRSGSALAGAWRLIAKITFASASSTGLFFLLFLTGLSYFMLSGNAFEFWPHKP
ncbi:hypothetical protein GCN78_25560 [Janthinobacterium rivuli]|uniref:hypothetical protein n=1 Tax=Janthinobacterium sp. FT68W TaxID=2654255 RepID=UPI0012653965|nr:hypothetical protein [Janthinobacterium sp. FT68W]KAB8046202.1 hypothetical protein GCN78_25560 [Janthinobacterium sp. FT68W]